MTAEPQSTQLSLPPHEAHVWLVNPAHITDVALLQSYFPLMNEEESIQQQRFYREVDRHRYLVTRALARTTLSRYIRRDPASWEFVFNEYRRPEITPAQQDIPLRFNLSHTRELIACVVNLTHDAGVDVEDITRNTGVMNIANYSFAPGETEALLACSEDTRQHLFFVYWTLKEAYIKARGMGLSLPLHQFSFHRSTASTIHIDFAPDFDQPQHWQFARYQPTDRHFLSLAFHHPQSIGHAAVRPYNLRLFWVTPLQGYQEIALAPVQLSGFEGNPRT